VGTELCRREQRSHILSKAGCRVIEGPAKTGVKVLLLKKFKSPYNNSFTGLSIDVKILLMLTEILM
jgi:hypothetical protein